MLRKHGLLLFSFLWFFCAVQPSYAQPQINGQGAVLLDVESGQVLFTKEKDKKLPPASITKILTAIMAIESGKMEEIVTIGPNPRKLEGTSVYLEEGEKVKLRELVKAALVYSANDAALAIGEYLGGTEEKFVKTMNERAREMGAQNSNFVNSHGLSVENHYTTAYDMALIARYAMQNEIFREIVKIKVQDWQGKAWQTRLINKNQLLWSYEGATGIKTGYTTEAKCTIVASATRGTQSFLAVVLGSQGKTTWTDAQSLLDYGFSNFHTVQLANAEEIAATVNLSAGKKLLLQPEQELRISVPNEGKKKVEFRMLLEPLGKKVEKGQVMGKMFYYVDGEQAGAVDLVAQSFLTISSWRVFDYLIYVAAGLYFCQILWRIYQRYGRRKRNIFAGRSSRIYYRD